MLLEEVDTAVEAYEIAREERVGEAIDLRAFAPDPDSPSYAAVVVELIRVDMEHSWRQTAGSRLEHYRAAFPEVLLRSDCLSQIAFEEFRLRVAAGEQVNRLDYEHQYGIDTSHWPELSRSESSTYATRHPNFSELSILEPQFASSLANADELFPHAGQSLWGFRLIEELGRGAFGRVYLARQSGLADRLVALKVTVGVSNEPIKLAQLQHTNIVPIYSQHGDDVLQGFCMPFLGRTTLAQSAAAHRKQVNVHDAFASTMRNSGSPTASSSMPQTVKEKTRRKIQPFAPVLKRQRDQIDNAARLIQKLAVGLQHAHDRGIIHCDLKPANILLSDEGEPLILDFHIARARTSGTAAIIGGTLPYMSPEQLIAFDRGGDVDVRSDIYSLGVILYELLAGSLPYPPLEGKSAECLSQAIVDRRMPPPPLSSINREVTPGLAAIVAKCLAYDLDDRYASAAQLADDLERHLNSLPLRYASDRSLPERMQKWCRRHPRLASSSTVAIVAGMVLLIMASAWKWREEVLAVAAANAEFHEVERELPVLWGLAETETLDPRQRTEFRTRAAGIAARYPLVSTSHWQAQPSIAKLPSEHQSQLLDHLRLIAFLEAELALRDARRADQSNRASCLEVAEQAHQRLRNLDLDAQNSAALARQGDLLAALQNPTLTFDATIRPLAPSTPANALDRRLFALQLMVEHHEELALPLLEELASNHPDDVALLLQLGNCYRALERLPEAEGCYIACAALRPDLAFPFYFRGLLDLDQQNYAAAVRNFELAIARDESSSSHVNLALAYRGLNEHRHAATHLERALALQTPETRVWLLLAHTRQQLGDEAGAALARHKWRESTPTDALSWIALGVDQLATDESAAASSFQEALRLMPHSRPALQNLSHIMAERRNQPEQAIALLTEALQTAPSDALLLGSRAVLNARLDAATSARDDAAAALQRAPRSAMAWYQAACVEALLAKGDETGQSKALAMLEQTVALDPSLGRLFASDRDLQSLHQLPRLTEVIALARRLGFAQKIDPREPTPKRGE